ncbi:MAG TPA: hypothetical protein VFO93_01980 [Hymenobacter sp.]|uniref:hypothetical protein n=1 Tax=Hymenobacter sp. TaxID=1898978 RepID=UPI002D7F61E2|nr:hypothetical protein [Hymenobacter sp.]HET9502280.1 hypothetical protein [Hymenobacter sp.]
MNETLTTRNADCQLTVTATYQEGGALGLHYEVQNLGPLTLYVCHQLSEPAAADAAGPPPPINHNLVHVQVEPAGVHLDKALMDLSFRDGIRVLDIPFLTQVLPGQSHAQALSLAVPLLPYRALGGRPEQAPPVRLPVLFSLGYFKGGDGITASEVAANIYQIATSHSQEQQVLTVGPFQELVPVANATPSRAPAPASSPAQWTPWG